MHKKYHPWARYRRAAGFTQLEVAERLNVTRHYIIRLEQSLFWHPPDSLLVRLSLLYDVPLDIFEMSYYDYVRETREEFAKTHQSFVAVLGREFGYLGSLDYTGRLHPLVHYRDAYEMSRMGLCKGLCLHYDPITEYEGNNQRDVPEQLKEACEEMKWDWQPLARAVADWRKNGYADRARTA